MNIYSNYSSLLNYDYSNDYWSDEGIDEAVEILQQFSKSDWELLKNHYSQESDSWQVRCAGTLSEMKTEISVTILLELLGSESISVVESAADSLNSLSQSGIFLEIDDSNKKIIEKIALSEGVASIVAKRLINSLEKK